MNKNHKIPKHVSIPCPAWLPDSYSQIFRSYVFGTSGLKDYGSATLRCKIGNLDAPPYQLLVEVEECGVEVPVHGLPDDGGVEVVSDGGVAAGALVEEEEGVEEDVEGVDGELVLPPHRVHELELHRLGAVVAQGDEAPAVAVVHLHHLRGRQERSPGSVQVTESSASKFWKSRSGKTKVTNHSEMANVPKSSMGSTGSFYLSQTVPSLPVPTPLQDWGRMGLTDGPDLPHFCHAV